jgi:hypothetical protein
MNVKMFRNVMSAAVVALALSATSAWAGPIGDTGSFNYTRVNGYHTGSGGEFTLFNLNGISNAGYAASTKNIANQESLETFCLELNEYAASPSYFVVGSAATKGGETVSDPISQGTAYLYSQFAQGTLTGYFSGSRSANAGLLQQAIWALEGETAAPVSGANAYYDLAMFNGGTTTAAQGYLGVYVLNNFTTAAARDAFKLSGTWTEGAKAQDFLYFVPDGGATVALLGASLVVVGALRRRYNI